MLEGVVTPTALANRTGLTFHTARRWMEEIHERWARSYSPDELRDRAEAAYAAAGVAGAAAWADYAAASTPADRRASLRLVLAANRQKALVCGLLRRAAD